MSKQQRILRRHRRLIDFRWFQKQSTMTFREIATNDPEHEFFEKTYSFHVGSGGVLGTYDKRLVEVSYGQRPFEAVMEPPKQLGSPPYNRLLAEGGTTLRYLRGDDGVVVCLLYPAHSANYRRNEDAILLSVIRRTHILTGKAVLERHWRAFISYMKYTSLDGEPSITDITRVWWLLFTRRLILNNKTQIPRLWTFASQLLKFSATVGLSGFLLALVQMFLTQHK